MRTLALVEFVTLDGVMQGLGSPEEDTDGGFTEGGWGVPYAEVVNISPAELNETTAYLNGCKTYEKMAAFWPFQPDSNPMPAHLNSTPKYVATRTLTDLAWRGSHLLRFDILCPQRKATRAATPIAGSSQIDPSNARITL